MRYWLFHSPWGLIVILRRPPGCPVWDFVQRQADLGLVFVPLKAGPFHTLREAEAARRRWEEPP